MVEITFWGTRGSFFRSDKRSQEFGGHTSCVSFNWQENLVILDGGSGLSSLPLNTPDRSLSPEAPPEIHLFLSHFHLDHIIGLPFFSPLWDPRATLYFYGAPSPEEGSMEEIFKGIFRPPYFPVKWDDTPSHKIYRPLKIGNIFSPFPQCSLHTISLDHPGGGCGYSFKLGLKTLVYLSDTNHTGKEFLAFRNFAQNADLLIYDAMFDEETHKKLPHFGHSTWEKACELAQEANVRHLALYHHDFFRSDLELLHMERKAKERFPCAFAARCGQKTTL